MPVYVSKRKVPDALWKITNSLNLRGVLSIPRILQLFEELPISDIWLLAVGAVFDHMPNSLADEALRFSVHLPLINEESRFSLESWGYLSRNKNNVLRMPPKVREYLVPRAQAIFGLCGFKG